MAPGDSLEKSREASAARPLPEQRGLLGLLADVKKKTLVARM